MTKIDIAESLNTCNIPEEFYKLVDDFTGDILNTFPEYMGVILKWWNKELHIDDEEIRIKQTTFLYKHCLRVYPERVTDILSKNSDIFSFDSVVSTEFLPGIVFKMLWNQEPEISNKNKETIWRYLQLILVSVFGGQQSLGDTTSIFDNINEDELKEQVQATLENMTSLFEDSNFEEKISDSNSDTIDNPSEERNNDFFSNIGTLQDQLKEMMGGKLGQLAMEMAKDTANNMSDELNSSTSPSDILQNMFSKPGKMMDMVKDIGSKLDEKIKTGDIKENELLKEGLDLISNMKDIPGFDSLFSKMSNTIGKTNTNTEKKNNRNIYSKLNKKQQPPQQQISATPPLPNISDEELFKIFDSVDKNYETNIKTK